MGDSYRMGCEIIGGYDMDWILFFNFEWNIELSSHYLFFTSIVHVMTMAGMANLVQLCRSLNNS